MCRGVVPRYRAAPVTSRRRRFSGIPSNLRTLLSMVTSTRTSTGELTKSKQDCVHALDFANDQVGLL